MAKVELYINDTLVDLMPDFTWALNYQISDISRPETRQVNYSKTVTLPASKTNNSLFGHLYNLDVYIDNTTSVNFTPDFSPNLKTSAVLYVDGVEQFRGIVQLMSITKTDNLDIVYNCQLLGELVDLFQRIGDEYLTDLDFSAFDHAWTQANIESSWDTSITEDGGSTPFELGNGYVYPHIDYGFGSSVTNFSYKNYRPAIYVKEYIDAIFESAGFTYDSDFFTSSDFCSLIVPFSNGTFQLTTEDIAERLFASSRTTSAQSFTTSATVIFNSESSDPSSQYNTATGIFTVGAGLDANYNFHVELNPRIVLTPATSGVAMYALHDYRVSALLQVDTGGGYSTVNVGFSTWRVNQFTTSTDSDTDGTWITQVNSVGDGVIRFNTGNLSLFAGDKVRVRVSMTKLQSSNPAITIPIYLGKGATDYFYVSNTYYTGTEAYTVKTGSEFRNNIDSPEYEFGNTINMNAVVPQNVKQKDFLLWIIRMFNLYIKQDEEVQNRLIIEPRDEFYTSTVVDWSDKLDTSNAMDIKPMAELEGKRYIFRYKEDKDYFNTLYQDSWRESYGQRTIDITNDFLRSDKVIEVGFSPTPMVGNTVNDMVYPRILSIDDNGTVKTTSANVRILHYSGLKTTNGTYIIDYPSGSTTYGEYPFAGHVDNALTPTLDLSWGVPAEIYWTSAWGAISYTNGNLVNKYWQKQIDETTDRNSKVITAYFNLNALDILSLDFAKLYYFDKQYFRLNKIIDYNPIQPQLTKCEFLKLIGGVPFAGTSTNVDGGKGTNKPQFATPFRGNGNTGKRFDITVSGNNNRVAESAQGITISGDNNIVTEGVEDVFITGDNNGVAASSGIVITGDNNVVSTSSNVTLINTNNKVIGNQTNVVFINGIAMYGGYSHEHITSSKSTDFEHRVLLCDATSGSITLELPAPENYFGYSVIVKKVDSSSNYVRINASANGSTIDKDTSIDITDQFVSYEVYSDGEEWHIILDYDPTGGGGGGGGSSNTYFPSGW
jgi:hypothetical protein